FRKSSSRHFCGHVSILAAESVLGMAVPFHPALPQALNLAGQYLQRGDIAAAERALAPLSLFGQSGHPEALNMLSAIRAAQGRFDEAVTLLIQARTVPPGEPLLACN